MVVRPACERLERLARSLLAMRAQLFDAGARVRDREPVRRVHHAQIERQQLLERRHVVVEVASGRRDHRGRPAHDVVAAHQRAVVEQVAEVIGSVTRRVDRAHADLARVEHLAVGDGALGHVVAARREAERRRAEVGAQPRRERPVIEMVVRGNHRRHRRVAHRRHDAVEVRVALRAGVEDEEPAARRSGGCWCPPR